MESRTNSALFKRAEQLRRWEESDTNKEPPIPCLRPRRIKFSDGCVFLSACAAGDKDEVLKLIKQGADIDTPNVDGLTALHQACIDDNLDMVEFLVAHGADINRGDHEGWTPLHATASCGFLSIARFLIDHGADVAAVNNDGELPIDIAETEAIEELLEKETQNRAIDCDSARSREEWQMLSDVAQWLEGDPNANSVLRPHPRTGATALHVAAAKGYIRVMGMLIQGGADLNAQDFDGWTSLHAAAHWGQREACQLLCENMADMEIRNYVGQTCFDVADPDVLRLLEDCKKRQAVILRERPEIWNNKLASKNSVPPKRRSSVTRLSQSEKAALITSSKMVDKISPGTKVAEEEKENSTESGTESPEDETLKEVVVPEKKPPVHQVRADSFKDSTLSSKVPSSGPPSRPPPSVDLDSNPSSPSQTAGADGSNDVPSWRRAGSVRTKPTPGSNGDRDSASQTSSLTPSSPSGSGPTSSLSSVASSTSSSVSSAESEVTLRRAHSFESDKGFYSRLQELRRRIKASSLPLLVAEGPGSGDLEIRSNSRHDSQPDLVPERKSRNDTPAATSTGDNVTTTTATVVLATQSSSPGQTAVRSVATLSFTPATSPSVTTVKLSPGAVIKNFFKSFVPPVRDEESETQRKAHAKRVRETRRSTQGVTLEEVKSAEQLVKKQQNDTTAPNEKDEQESKNDGLERRPSWRLCVSDTNKNKFSLEDSRNKSNGSTVSVVAITTSTSTATTASPVEADTVVTIPLRRGKPQEEEKESSSSTNAAAVAAAAAAATQAAIQRRRRPKRRSTGVVQIDVDDLDPSKDSGQSGDNDGQSDDSEALSDRASNASSKPSRPSSLASSTSDLRDEAPASSATTPVASTTTHSVAATAAAVASGAINANGEIDYRKLWEDSQLENERLRERLRVSQEDLGKYKEQLEKALQVSNARNAMTEAEKRERRALERKLSEMEEELKQSEQQVEQLRADNSRLRDENGALIRVISKLSK